MIAAGINRGALLQAEWLAGDFVNREARLACALGLSIEMIERWHEGESVPGENEREAIGRLTEGAVTGAMWDETVLPTVIGIDGGGVCDASALTNINDALPPVVAPAQPPALLCEISGPLGSVPSGPPFRVITDPMVPGQFVLAGPGMAIVLDEALGWAMRGALTMGLQDIRAEARPIAAAAGRTIG